MKALEEGIAGLGAVRPAWRRAGGVPSRRHPSSQAGVWVAGSGDQALPGGGDQVVIRWCPGR
ncbi:hypothetical protein GCM10009680_68790 [Streptomyces yatensis]|uniref:Uncharacterized protein n=1 Tax=Streptomyces yatensis TaxID=155177 RepID=A0ABN2J4U9_9ACTN